MRHPYENYIKGEIITIVLAVIIGLFALIKGYLILLILCLYFIAFSIFCDAIIDWYSNQAAQAGKQFLRAIMLILMATAFLIYL